MNHGYDLPERLVVDALIAERVAAAEAERLIRNARRVSVAARRDSALAPLGRLLIGLGESLAGRRAAEDPCAGAGAH